MSIRIQYLLNGCFVGCLLGLLLGCKDGLLIGCYEGWSDGTRVGWSDGIRLGWSVGIRVGCIVWRHVGMLVGKLVGMDVGTLVGKLVGMEVGTLVGKLVGMEVGSPKSSRLNPDDDLVEFISAVYLIGTLRTSSEGKLNIPLLTATVLTYVWWINVLREKGLSRSPFRYLNLDKSVACRKITTEQQDKEYNK